MRSRISSGLLAPGTGLPPERSLAHAIGVSRSTLVAALDELRAEGFLASRQGSGTWVADTDNTAVDGTSSAERLLLGARNINLAASVPADASHLPDMAVDVADLASVTPAHGYTPAGLPGFATRSPSVTAPAASPRPPNTCTSRTERNTRSISRSGP